MPHNPDTQKRFICRLIDTRLDTTIYEYSIAGESKSRILVLFEKYDISIKKITDQTSQKPEKPDELKDFLIIPLNTNYTSFANIENQLCRKKNDPVGTQTTYEDFLRCFIIDLYINNVFRSCGDVLSIKAALEYVPLINGIIYSVLYDYHNENLEGWPLSVEKNSHQFEDVYLNYSRFLANPENERLFLQNGWFAEGESHKRKSDLDTHIFRVEKKYLDYVTKNKKNSGEKKLLNTRNILKRYGVLDVLRLTVSKGIAIAFLFAAASVVFFILFDIVHYNYHQPDHMERLNGFWCRFAEYGLFGSVLFFSLVSLIVLAQLIWKFRFKIIPAIFLPRLVIAIISGWVLFLTGEELMKIDLDISGRVLFWLFTGVTSITVIFMAFETNNFAPAMGWKKVFGRSLLVCAIGFIVSYAFGFWIMSYVTKQFMSIDNYLTNQTEIKQKFDNRIFYVDTFVIALNNKPTVEKRNYFAGFELKEDSVLIVDSASRMKLDQMAKSVADTAVDLNRTIAEFSNLAYTSYISKSGEDLFWKQLTSFPQFRANKTKYYARTYSWPVVGTVTTFPNMLLARALLALFIGIFFQLIIQDKSITEPI